MTELQEAVLEDQEPKVQASPLAEISWSSIVKKNISPSLDSQEVRKEMDLEPLKEVEEKPEVNEHMRKLQEAEFDDRDDSTFLEFLESAGHAICEYESMRRACRIKEKEEKDEEEEEEEEEKEEEEKEKKKKKKKRKELLFCEKDNIDVTKTTMVEENILVDLHAPIVDEEPHVDKDIARITTAMARAKISWDKGNNKVTEGNRLLALKVRSVVDETCRGNVTAERRESQREPSLQLQSTRQMENSDDDDEDDGNSNGNGDDIGASERFNLASSKVFPESTNHGPAEKQNEAEREVFSEHSTAARKASNRSKRKKRR